MKQTIKMTESELRQVVSEIIQEGIEEGKFGRAMAGLGLAATIATAPACSHFNHYEPQWEHVGPYSEQEKQEKTWNTHAERGDWNEIEPGVGFIYDCYTRCANNGGGWTIHVIFSDKSTGKFILPQECQQYLYGRYMPNCNCFENENTTDRVNTNSLQRVNGNENVTVFESKQHMYDEGYWKHNKNMKQDKLVEAIKNSIKQVLNEGPGAGYDVSFKGLNISQLRSFKVGEKNGQRIIEFKAILAPGIVEWSAAGYYDSVTSKGIYYDNELVDEFDEQQKTVNGGELSGYVYESEVSDYIANGGQVTTKDVSDYIRWHLQDFSFKTMVGGGYVHTDLSDPMVFENVEVTPEDSYYGSEGVYLNYIEIRAKNISDTINWFFANCYNFDEIYGQNDEDYAEEQPVNESLKKVISKSIAKVLKESHDGEDVYTIDIFDINNEESIYDMRYAVDYATTDEAINAARQAAKQYSNYDDVINVFVMAGEYKDANGNVFGEPDAIYCISNKDKNTTIEARRKAGYTRAEADEYNEETHDGSLLENVIRKSIAKVLTGSNI